MSSSSHLSAYIVGVLVGALTSGSSWAADPPNPKDLTQGNWQADFSRSKYCEGQSQGQRVPRVSRRQIIDAGWGLISVHWTGIDADGKPMDIRYVYRYDGQKYPADLGDTPAKESITWKLVNPHRVEFVHRSKGDKVTQRLTRTVSEDGQTMTQTTRYTNRPGCEEVQVFERQP
jgi:hypothetical protein